MDTNDICKYLCKCFQNFSAQYELKIKLQKIGKHFTNLERGALCSSRSLWKFFEKEFLVEILWKNPNRIWDERWQISAQRDKYSTRKRSNCFTHKRTFLLVVAMMNIKFIANLVERLWGSKLNHNSIHTIRNVWLKFQIETPKEYCVISLNPKQRKLENLIFQNQNVLAFLPYIFFCVFFLDMPLWLDTNDICVSVFKTFQLNMNL